MRRARLRFIGGLEIEFVDRDKAIEQINEIAEKGTYPVYVVYGPEGCGKTALFKQAREILEEHNYNVVYANPLAEDGEELLGYTPAIRDLARDVLRSFPDPYSRVIDAAISIASQVMKRMRKPRVAVLMDDIFQAVGLDNAEKYVKTLLNLIEYPPGDYENIVVLVSSSEGITRKRIGRHSWATLRTIWNMGVEGFRELYDKIPGTKPRFEDTWRTTGGNPRYLGLLYRANWGTESLIEDMVKSRELEELVKELSPLETRILQESLEDPDTLFEKYPETKTLIDKLVERNLVIRLWDRNERNWIDTPPPEKDSVLGIGRHYAWQTPLHREAVRRALERAKQ